jgi:4'-phosphopantetheinyl transferase
LPLVLSISHAGDRVVLAITDQGGIGIDVEALDSSIHVDELGASALCPSELSDLHARPAAHRRHAFLVYWTRKEAVLKARLEGLRVDPATFCVSAPHQSPALVSWPDEPAFVERVTMHGVDPDARHVACLALIDHKDARLVERSAADLFRSQPDAP